MFARSAGENNSAATATPAPVSFPTGKVCMKPRRRSPTRSRKKPPRRSCDPHYAAAGYILAVMLERKRILKVKEQIIRDGRRTFIYEQPRTGDVFTIADPDLHLDQLEAVQRDVAMLLEQGLNPPPLPSETAAANTVPSGEPGPAEPKAAPAQPEAVVETRTG